MVSERTWAHVRGLVKAALCILKSAQSNTTNRRWSTRCRCQSLLLAQGTQLLTSKSSKEKTVALHVGKHNQREARLRVFVVEGVRSATGRRNMWTEFPSEEKDGNSSKGRGGTKWEGRGGQSWLVWLERRGEGAWSHGKLTRLRDILKYLVILLSIKREDLITVPTFQGYAEESKKGRLDGDGKAS